MPYRGQSNKAIRAWHTWAAVFGRDATFESICEFAVWTGDPPSDIRSSIINVNNPEVMKKIEAILGPNGHTLLKMWKAQQDGSICNE